MSDNTLSLIRTGLKIGGTVLATTGALSADQVGTVTSAMMDIVGAMSALYGIYLSWQTHK